MKNWIIGDDCCSLLSIPYAYAPTPCLTDPSHPMSTFLRFISLTIFFSSDRGIAVSLKVRSYGSGFSGCSAVIGGLEETIYGLLR